VNKTLSRLSKCVIRKCGGQSYVMEGDIGRCDLCNTPIIPPSSKICRECEVMDWEYKGNEDGWYLFMCLKCNNPLYVEVVYRNPIF